jgi:hypothetical protein
LDIEISVASSKYDDALHRLVRLLSRELRIDAEAKCHRREPGAIFADMRIKSDNPLLAASAR